ncbi:endopeptidase La [uncultured Phascolarctobacterium sp.]|uniref:endopeptidase La n=1 Tax=uncultured Phascolarctobacterium sp. TaxID=512296 RepID=UPI0026169FBF|nr:endopeptidase La [uncultured Phascolarctobacterium sp.]
MAEIMENKNNLLTMPLLALRGLLVLPGMLVNVDVGRDKSMAAVRVVMEGDKRIILAAQKDAAQAEVTAADLYSWGVVAEIKQQLTLPSGAMRLLVEGLERVQLSNVAEVHQNDSDFFVGQGFVINSIAGDVTEETALRRLLLDAFENWVLVTKKINADVVQAFKAQPDTGRVADMMTGYLPISLEEKEQILETADINGRLRYLYEIMTREQEIAALAKNISKQVHEQVEQNQKEYYLREQIKAISQELGEAEDVQSEIAEYKRKIAELKLPENVNDKLNKEFSRLLKMPPMTPEGAVIRSYIDALLSLPWGKFTEDNFDLKLAQQTLDKDHYGLKKVKERILEYLAVRALSKSSRGPILCLVGPPGVGKTSLAFSIARAIGRNFTRISLGGVHDESEIRGHRRTYIGSMPGRIIHGMQTAGCMNPVFLLDEVDKMASDFRGDPASALLEVLDPEQNHSFSDHFIEFPFDLSNVFWIVTANSVETIPLPLRDRMEIISLSSYTDEEKVKIAQLHLLPKEIKLNGLENYKVSVSEKAIRRIIHDYTREAGVRNLERKLAGVCRKIAYRIVQGKNKSAMVSEKNLEKYLGKVLFMDDDISLEPAVGVCNGLAWTSVGGELLKVEVLAFKGKGNLTLTGQLGDVMKESAQAGYTYIRSRAKALGLEESFSENTDLHIHLPEGAVPKDGPSAGVTMVTAMVSALTEKCVKGKLAMTGEITLSGKVWPVGGIKEKMLAAYRYGIKTVLLPKRNLQDLDELPDNVRKAMEFIAVEHLDDVLRIALEDCHE